jgi:hypothetical protein
MDVILDDVADYIQYQLNALDDGAFYFHTIRGRR